MKSALFEIMRFQILTASITKGPDGYLNNAYIYAWNEGIYPLHQESASMHKPFPSEFKITKEMVDELGKNLDTLWMQGKSPTFYELEDIYQVWLGSTIWDRVKLMTTCRYLFLSRLFDEAFWKKLLSQANHPTEAAFICREFSREDIYLL
ncbi:hypothetical protein HA051_08315 [Chromobacterium vaccinii]|nr:hypothetical protein [Chromobacterium vaccinii]